MPNYMNVWIRKSRKKLIQDYGGKCSKCKSIFNLEFAHVSQTKLFGRGRGRKERYYDIINNPTKYILLCNKCHYLRDKPII